MHDRRQDPRDDTRTSLLNLLNLRSLRERFSLAVLGTADGVLMAGTREDRPAQRVAAHSAYELFRGKLSFCDRFVRSARNGATLSGVRFQVQGRSLCLAVLRPDAAGGDAGLDEIVARVRSILGEGCDAPALRRSA